MNTTLVRMMLARKSAAFKILGILAALFQTAAGVATAAPARHVLSLDGQWQIAEGKMDQAPAAFDRTAPVPGLASLATPAFVNSPGPKIANREQAPQKDPKRDAFWYRRTFRFSGGVPAVAEIKVRKAMFGTRVFLNGTLLGDHAPSFTTGYFDAKPALKTGNNEILIRVGADRDAVRRAHPDGFDFEKTRYIPGIFDSVELICSGTPQVVNVQAVPDVAGRRVRVQALLRNAGPEVNGGLHFTVREAKSGKVAGEAVSPAENLRMGAERTVTLSIPIANCRLWSPEDPFLYEITTDSGADIVRTRFGMREFKFDPTAGRALLNGKPYFMRGSNITLYRFFEDSECGHLPWDEKWVRLLHRRVKDMGWNCLRYCIGFPPEAWYDIADEAGILIDDEFPIWFGGDVPKEWQTEELAQEYTEWMRERWNHPCVAIWDACNETRSPKTGAAFKQIRALDLSNRPWDNGYTPPQEPGDMLEEHPYHFYDPHFKLANLATANPQAGDGHHAVVINEYGWLWLNRDGTPTTLTSQLYRNLLGENSTTEQRRHLYATYTAAETEFWRHGRQAAAVMHFTTLGYSRPDGQTSDHWLNVKKLQWEPEFVNYVRDAFAPVGVMIDAWREEYPAGENHEFPVSVINDYYEDWRGTVRFRLAQDGKVVQEKAQSCEVAALGKTRLSFRTDIPTQPGRYQLEAALLNRGTTPVRSVREFSVLTAEAIKGKRSREGLAYLKTATASSVHSAAYAAANAVDGDPATYWSSTFADPAWLAVDLGEVCQVGHVLIAWETAYSKAFVLQASRDGQNWTDLHTEGNCQGGTSDIRFSPVEARYVRIYGTKRATEWGHAIREFKVFE